MSGWLLSIEEIEAEVLASQTRADTRRVKADRRRWVMTYVWAITLALLLAAVAVLGVYVV